MTTSAKTNKKVIAVVGATASGKTAYAIELAKKLDGEIISADSRLVYKGFDIGTAKPSLEERDGVPHHLIDVVEPEVDYSVGLWAKEAERLIDEIISRGKIPIIAGGTGLYFRILLEKYDLPKVEANYELREELGKLEFDQLRERLYRLDPETAEKIERNDKKKMIRALEIVETTGVPMKEARGVKEFSPYDVEWHGRNFAREELYERINKRVDLMIESGLIEETRKLLEKHGRIPNLVDTIGYREIIEYIDGNTDLNFACEKLKQNTRRYAKRQLTWFRKNSDIVWNLYPETK